MVTELTASCMPEFKPCPPFGGTICAASGITHVITLDQNTIAELTSRKKGAIMTKCIHHPYFWPCRAFVSHSQTPERQCNYLRKDIHSGSSKVTPGMFIYFENKELMSKGSGLFSSTSILIPSIATKNFFDSLSNGLK
jgi:hypothetical protein